MGAITLAIRGLTARVIAYRMHLENERMTMESRIREKLKLASGVVARVGAKIEARADAVIAREVEFGPAIDEAFHPHESMLAEAEASLDGFRDELKQVTNGPLPSSPTPPPASAPGSPEVELPKANFQFTR